MKSKLVPFFFFFLVTQLQHSFVKSITPETQPAARLPLPKGQILHAGILYWAGPRSIICGDWKVVLEGTVLETYQQEGHDTHPEPFHMGTLKVERVFLNKPSPQVFFPTPMLKYYRSDAFDDLKVGDRIIVFIQEYDGGYGVTWTLGSNSKLGIKIKSWDDPIVSALEKVVELPYNKRIEFLKTHPEEKAVWARFSNRGKKGVLEWESCYEE